MTNPIDKVKETPNQPAVPSSAEKSPAPAETYSFEQTQALNKKLTFVLPLIWMGVVCFCAVLALILQGDGLQVIFGVKGIIGAVLLTVAWVVALQFAYDGAKKSKPRKFHTACILFGVVALITLLFWNVTVFVLNSLFSLLGIIGPFGLIMTIVNLVMAGIGFYHCWQARKHVVEIDDETLAALISEKADENAAEAKPDTKKNIVLTYNALGGIVMGISVVLIILGIMSHELAFLAMVGILGFGLGFIFLKMDDSAVKNRASRYITITKKGVLITIVVLVLLTAIIAALPSRGSNKGKGGYNMPNSSHGSVTDYIKDEDPDLWNDMQDRWNSLGN